MLNEASLPPPRGKDRMGVRIMALPTQLVRHLRRHMTEAEKALWRHLRLRQMGGCKFRRQHPLGNYVLDFVCLEKGVAVELDGGQHAGQAPADSRRDNWLEQQGITVLRFWNHDVLTDIESVKQAIWSVLQDTTPPSRPSPWEGEGGSSVAEH